MTTRSRTLRSFHTAAQARSAYQIEDLWFDPVGPLALADGAEALELAHDMNRVREASRFPHRAVSGAGLWAASLIQQVLRLVVDLQRERAGGRMMGDAIDHLRRRLGDASVEETLAVFMDRYPATPVYRGERTAIEQLDTEIEGIPARQRAVEELVLLRVANENPAFSRFRELCDDTALESGTAYREIIAALEEHFGDLEPIGPGGEDLFTLLRAPARASPTSLTGQLEYIRTHWAGLLGDWFGEVLGMILRALDAIGEEHAIRGLGGPPHVLGADDLRRGRHEYERFSRDSSWMPRLVLIAKSTYVWLDQLSRRFDRGVHRLDEVPDEELDALAEAGFTGLWLIGLWERSRASRRIKHIRGDHDAVASAYALYDYVIADDLGGHDAYENLRDRAWQRGIRLASDMVPNHVGIDGRWVIEHPERFLSLPQPPFPGYSFTGPDLSDDPGVSIQIEDHYWDGTDAAVVFKRYDRATAEARYIYHGNDGTSMPWNDTAQLDYLDPATREAVIRTILHVARLFPIIRFDAAMTLAKQHIQRLWYPAPGHGGAIPSRAAHGLTEAEFDRAMPEEFWREVVDRVAAEVPDTLLLAEAFWMLEGYFVRTLGMHRVYNSAFMHMTSSEDNGRYRRLMRDVLEFDPEILKRFVNFMNNPDEETAAAQFGKGDKYFGVATLLATLPGLPMFGHGQIEGLTEKYGMEYRRARWDERSDAEVVARHRTEISPLLHRRRQFAEAAGFLLYDFHNDAGWVDENVYAYSNLVDGAASLVLYNNSFTETAGWIKESVLYRDKASGALRTRDLADGLGLSGGSGRYLVMREHVTGLEYLSPSDEVAARGLRAHLHAYDRRVFLDLREVSDGTGALAVLHRRLGGSGVPSIADALADLHTEPLHDALEEVARTGGRVLGGDSAGRVLLERAFESLLEEADAAGIRLDPDEARAEFDRGIARLANLAAAVPPNRDPPFDPVWPAAWAGRRALGRDESGLRLDRLALDDAARWSAIIAGVEDRAAEIAAWSRTRGSREELRRLLVDLLHDPRISTALGVHEHGGFTWFDRDGFRLLGRGVAASALLDSPRAGRRRAGELLAAFRRIEEQSGYRVDRLIAPSPSGRAHDAEPRIERPRDR